LSKTRFELIVKAKRACKRESPAVIRLPGIFSWRNAARTHAPGRTKSWLISQRLSAAIKLNPSSDPFVPFGFFQQLSLEPPSRRVRGQGAEVSSLPRMVARASLRKFLPR
jgi:hypothetical protein